MTLDVTFRAERPSLEAFEDVLRASGLGERRPMDDAERMAGMLANANLVIGAWEGDVLVGVARSLTDWVWNTYLADLAVRESHQHLGIGRRLVDETVAACQPGCRIILLAAPAARDYYAKLGFEQHPSAWILTPNRP